MKELIRQAAARTLWRRDSRGFRFGCDHYYSFDHGQVPQWWDAALNDRYRNALGVYENHQNSGEDALVVTEEEIVVLGRVVVEIKYHDIASIGAISKEPVAGEIDVELTTGTHVHVPENYREGAIFTLVKYLYQAKAIARPSRELG